MKATHKITAGILVAAAVAGGGVLLGWLWPREPSGRADGPALGGPATASGADLASGEVSRPIRYRAATVLRIHPHPWEDAVDVQNPHRDWFETEVKICRSFETLMRAVKNLNLAWQWKLSADDAVTKLADLIEVASDPGARTITLSARSETAGEAVRLANAVREAYEQRLADRDADRARRLANEITQQQIAVESARQKMLRLQKEHGIVEVDAQKDLPAEYVAAKSTFASEIAGLNAAQELMAPLLSEEAPKTKPIEILQPAVAGEDR